MAANEPPIDSDIDAPPVPINQEILNKYGSSSRLKPGTAEERKN